MLFERAKSLTALTMASTPSYLSKPTIPGQVVLLGLQEGNWTLLTTNPPEPLQSFALFGPWSAPECLRRHLNHNKPFKIPRNLETAIDLGSCPDHIYPIPDATLPPFSVAEGLFRLFSRSANVFFPVLETTMLDHILSTAYKSDGEESVKPTLDLFYLILAIAALIGKRNGPSIAAQARSWFLKAISSMSMQCDHSSLLENIILLQRTLLMCVFLLLSPESGDLWRHLGYAIRHFFDLSHRPLTEEEEYRHLICTLTRTLYYLER